MAVWKFLGDRLQNSSPHAIGPLSCLTVTLVYWGQTVGQIKMKLGMWAGLCPGHIVLDEDPDPLPTKRGTAPNFSAHVYCGQTAGWIKMPLNTKVGLSPGHTVLHGDPQLTPQRGTAPPQFLVHVYCGQTVAHLSYCWALFTYIVVRGVNCLPHPCITLPCCKLMSVLSAIKNLATVDLCWRHFGTTPPVHQSMYEIAI